MWWVFSYKTKSRIHGRKNMMWDVFKFKKFCSAKPLLKWKDKPYTFVFCNLSLGKCKLKQWWNNNTQQSEWLKCTKNPNKQKNHIQKILTISNCCWRCSQGELLFKLVGIHKGYRYFGRQFLQNLNISVPYSPVIVLLGTYPSGMKNCMWTFITIYS